MTRNDYEPPVVVGVDGSPAAQHALTWAVTEATSRHVRLHILHSVRDSPRPFALGRVRKPEFDRQMRTGERVLDDAVAFARAAAPGATITSELQLSAPAAALLQWAHDAAVVVVGSRGLGGFGGLLMGSVSSALAAGAVCPVVVVRHGAGVDHESSPVVVGVDASDLSASAVRFALEAATRRGVGVTAVHAWSVPAITHPAALRPIASIRDDARRELEAAFEESRQQFREVAVDGKVVRARPSQALVAESAHASLVVVGSGSRAGARRLLGSVSQAVLQHGQCPVVTIPADANRWARAA